MLCRRDGAFWNAAPVSSEKAKAVRRSMLRSLSVYGHSLQLDLALDLV
jgi:hypothetical protein